MGASLGFTTPLRIARLITVYQQLSLTRISILQLITDRGNEQEKPSQIIPSSSLVEKYLSSKGTLMRKLAILMITILALTILAGCPSNSAPGKDRYVVLSPEVAEILASLGLESRIVGLTTECTYPTSLSMIHKVGAFGAVKLEDVLALKPSIVFTTALEQDGIAQDLSRLGIRVESVYPKSVNDIFLEIERIGRITGSDDKAAELTASMKQSIHEIQIRNSSKIKPDVYLEIYRDPLMSVSDKSFVGELIEIAGGNNVFDTLERDYSRVNPETVIAAKPDIMICFSQDNLPNILSRKGWQVIPALQDSMIFFEDSIDPDLIQRAGPRIIEGIMALEKIYEHWRTSTP